MRNTPFAKTSAKIFLSSLLAILLCAGCAGRVTRGNSLLTKELPRTVFDPAPPERWQLKNGLTVMYMRDKELPLVSVALYLKGGGLWEPANQRGVVSVMGAEMRDGGAGALNADQLDQEIEELSARFGSSFGGEYGTVGFECLSSDLDRSFSIFTDIIFHPRFEQSRLNLWKGHALEGIKRRTDDPNTVASIAFNKLLYGNTRYGQVLNERQVTSITRDQLIAAHKEFVRPDGAIITVAGNIDRETIARMIEKSFGSWAPRGREWGAPPPVDFKPKSGVYFISLPFEQSTIEMGQLGVPRLSPDYIAIDGFNEVFGSGGFGSRLMRRVRTELGLAYGVYGAIIPAVVKGKNIVSLQTKSASTAQAIDESLRELEKLQSEEVRQDELTEVKHMIEHSFVFRLDSTAALVQRYAMLELLKYPADYDRTYVDRILALQPSEIKKVANDRWSLNDFVVVVIGNETAYNSVKNAADTHPEMLRGMALQKIDFQKLIAD